MINNKGQTLIVFVVFLPLLIIIMATVIDITTMYQNKNKLDEINKMVISLSLEKLENKNLESEIKELILKNDDKIIIDNIKIGTNQININFHKNIESTFGKIIGIKEYKIVSKYEGTILDNKKELKKG